MGRFAWVILVLQLALGGAWAGDLRVFLVRDGEKTELTMAEDPGLQDLPGLQRYWRELHREETRRRIDAELARTPTAVHLHLVDDRDAPEAVWPNAHREGAVEVVEVGEVDTRRKFAARFAPYYRMVLLHEVAHTQDRASREPDAYGPDGRHGWREILLPRGAMSEGWANYKAIEASLSARTVAWLSSFSFLWTREEVTQEHEHPPARPCGEGGGAPGCSDDPTLHLHSELRWDPHSSFEDRISNESKVALVLWKLRSGLRDGAGKISRAFDATNDGRERTLLTLLRELCDQNPGDARRVLRILDAQTLFTASKSTLRSSFGEHGEAYLRWRTWMKVRHGPRWIAGKFWEGIDWMVEAIGGKRPSAEARARGTQAAAQALGGMAGLRCAHARRGPRVTAAGAEPLASRAPAGPPAAPAPFGLDFSDLAFGPGAP